MCVWYWETCVANDSNGAITMTIIEQYVTSIVLLYWKLLLIESIMTMTIENDLLWHDVLLLLLLLRS